MRHWLFKVHSSAQLMVFSCTCLLSAVMRRISIAFCPARPPRSIPNRRKAGRRGSPFRHGTDSSKYRREKDGAIKEDPEDGQSSNRVQFGYLGAGNWRKDCRPYTPVAIPLLMYYKKGLRQAARSYSIDPAVEIQREYYTGTASRYDSMHAHEGVGDSACRNLIISILRSLEIQSLCDVGSATGRGLQDFATSFPGALVCGVEPVRALVQQGVATGNARTILWLQASGEALPFADGSFDAVSEFSILHHVPNPSAVVREMLRVARKAVVIVDCNRFGQGSLPARLFKLFLYKTGLWHAFNFVRTRGKRYQISEGDGLFYSYSVYDSYDLVASWADRLLVLPSSQTHSQSWFHPLLTAEGVILVAIRENAKKCVR